MAPITINGNNFDPDNATTKTRLSIDVSNSNYIVVQCKSTLLPADRKSLEDVKVELLDSVGSFSYVCRYLPKDLTPVTKVTCVKVAFAYPSEYVLRAGLDKIQVGPDSSFAVMLHDPESATASKIVDQIKLKVPSVKILSFDNGIAQVQATLTELKSIATIDAVAAIEDIPKLKDTLNLAREAVTVDKLQGNLISANFTGAGQVVAVVDTGLANGQAGPNNDWGHPMFKNQVIAATVANRGAGLVDDENHGTMMASCVAGLPYKVSDPRLRGTQTPQGIAPGAKLFIIANNYTTGFASLENLYSLEYQDSNGVSRRAPINNNSWWTVATWQADTQAGYTNLVSRKLDMAMRRDPSLLIVNSAGNAGGTWSNTGAHVSQSSVAKNVLTVGAVCNARPLLLDDHRGWEWNGTNVITGDLANFSNRGPCLNGRLKPDLVAPGAAILAAKSPKAVNPSPDPEKPFIDANDLEKDRNLQVGSGTSPAAAIVSGCAAVLREALVKKSQIVNPTGALLKALLVNGATDLAGHHALINHEAPGANNRPVYSKLNMVIPPAPNGLQGHGLVNVQRSMQSINAGRNANSGGIAEKSINSKTALQDRTVTWTNDKLSDLYITLAYNDLEGEAIKNDLRIEVRLATTKGAGSVRRADPIVEWRCMLNGVLRPIMGLAGEQVLTPPTVDNNLQKITWKNMPAGEVTVEVTLFATAPSLPPDTSVDYALAWSVFSPGT